VELFFSIEARLRIIEESGSQTKFMTTNLQNKRAIVTGGSKGIGLAIAQSLITEGTDVLICSRDQKAIDQAVSIIQPTAVGRIFGVTADVSRFQDVQHLFAEADRQLGGLDILVNNAGFGIFRPTADLTVEDWDQVIATNLSGAFYCSKEALARFKKSGGGQIINLSSLAGKNPFAGGAAYNASKFGMNGFGEAMMLDHRADNVRVSCVMPGSVDTEFGGAQSKEKSSWKIAPEDIAEIVLGILKMPERTLISRVEVRPSVPKKD
jgi:NAD(P)-dependent dehydrogenase (short-subunit alcohol dehydrogenase family)